MSISLEAFMAQTRAFEQLQAENKDLMERIELAVGYLPESPDKALSFLKPEQEQ